MHPGEVAELGAFLEFEEAALELLSSAEDQLYVVDGKQDIMLVDSYKALVVAVAEFDLALLLLLPLLPDYGLKGAVVDWDGNKAGKV